MSRWQATELDRTTLDKPVYPPKPPELATVDGQRLVADGTELVRQATWRHNCGAKPNAAHVSADRVLVTTDSLDYHAWGNLGPALLLDLASGERVAELRGERAAALDGGRFLLGLEGYGTFETWLHDRDGKLVTTWHSYGHYVVDTHGVRVVECDRVAPTKSAVVRLLPNGAIDRGHPLRDGLAPAPVVLPDGTIMVLDAGVLLAIGPDLRGRQLATVFTVPPEEHYRFHATLHLREGTLTVTVREQPREASGAYTTHVVRYALRL